jgi:hypothetical protein
VSEHAAAHAASAAPDMTACAAFATATRPEEQAEPSENEGPSRSSACETRGAA